MKLTVHEVAKEREVVLEAIPKTSRIVAKDLEDHGYSTKCSGCSSIL